MSDLPYRGSFLLLTTLLLFRFLMPYMQKLIFSNAFHVGNIQLSFLELLLLCGLWEILWQLGQPFLLCSEPKGSKHNLWALSHNVPIRFGYTAILMKGIEQHLTVFICFCPLYKLLAMVTYGNKARAVRKISLNFRVLRDHRVQF